MRRRSQLYVPANNPKMIRKAAGLQADSILFDLEDAVPPNEKAAARESLGPAIGGIEWGQRELAVRINAPEAPEGKQDLAAVSKEPRIATLGVPKAEPELVPLADTAGMGFKPI